MAKHILTRYEIMEFHKTLKQDLAGRAEPVYDGDGKFTGMVVKPFDFDDDARWAFAKTLRWIKDTAADIESVQKDIAARCLDKKNIEQVDKANEEIRQFMLKTDEIEVYLVAKSLIKSQTNKLPTNVITNLMWMITEEQADIVKEQEARTAKKVLEASDAKKVPEAAATEDEPTQN